MSSIIKKALITSLVSILIFPALKTFAQEPGCETIEECRDLLKELERKITGYEQDITKTQQEKKSLQNQIYLLKQKIEKLDLQIYQSNVMIKDLSLQIDDTEFSIEKTSAKIDSSREQLASVLRTIYEQDQKSLLEVLLSEQDLSGFFNNLAYLENLSAKNRELLLQIKSLKLDLESQRTALGKEKGGLENVVALRILQKEESQNLRGENEYLLKRTEGEEAEYQKYLQETKQEAAKIRARLFELVGVPQAPTFGEALEIAKFVSGVTRVRPALLLAVLKQESDLGKNVGQCNCGNAPNCRNSGLTWKDIMKKERDWQPFLQICEELGKDPYSTPVSCPMFVNGKQLGYGGAMGPAQFIPSTWLIYKTRVEQITGRKPADPWNIRDAFLAAGLYLSDYGAYKGDYNSEWRSAMIYFSGSTNPQYSFYGDSVMSWAAKFQSDIEAIERAE